MSAAIETAMAPEPSTALAIVPHQQISNILAADKEGILDALAAKVNGFKADVSKPSGRDSIRSLAREIRTVKTKLDNLGKDLTEDWRKRTTAVNAERNIIKSKLDELHDQVRSPLTAFEEAEESRVLGHENGCLEIEMAGKEALAKWRDLPATALHEKLAEITHMAGNRDWQEFAQRASDLFAVTKDQITSAISLREQADKDAAELRDLRARDAERKAAEAEQARIQREQEIAAAAAENARKEAEAKQQRQAAEIAHLEQAKEAARIQAHQDALAIIRRAQTDVSTVKDAEWLQHVLAGVDEVNRDWQEFAAEAAQATAAAREAILARIKVVEQEQQAEADRLAEQQAQTEAKRVQFRKDQLAQLRSLGDVDAGSSSLAFRGQIATVRRALNSCEWQEFQAEAETVAAEVISSLEAFERLAVTEENRLAELRQKEAADAAATKAREEERERQQAIAAQAESDRKAREADAEHRRKITTEATEALLAAVSGLSDAMAKRVIAAIDKGKVQHVTLAI